MTEDTARLVILCGAAVAWMVWGLGLRRWRRLGRPQPRAQPDVFQIEESEAAGSGPDLLRDEVEVEAPAAGLPEKFASVLASMPPTASAAIGPVEVQECSATQVAFRASSGLLGRWARMEGRVSFRPVGPSRSLAVIELDLSAFTRKLRVVMGVVLFGLGVPVLVGLPLVLWLVVAPHPNLGVRWQVVQIVQTVHVLWPPLLFGFLDSRLRRLISHGLRAVVRNLAYA